MAEKKRRNEEKYEQLRLKNQLCFPLYAAARAIVKKYTPYLKPLGLTYTQYIALMVLWEERELTVGELGQRLYLDNGTLTPMLKNMEKDGLVSRVRNSDDERVVNIQITQKGMELREKMKDIPSAVGSCVRLSPDDAASLYKMLYELLGDLA